MDARIPENVKTTPRCPLCHAMFDRRLDDMVKQRLEVMIAEAIVMLKASTNDKELSKNRRWCEMLEASIKGGAAEVFLCHHCKIGIACNDPFVDKWEAAYVAAGKETCSHCGTEMRFFCTSTGCGILDCPLKSCRSRIKRWLPDRLDAPVSGQLLFDDKGVPIALPNIDRAVATPDQMSDAQVGGLGKAEGLPDVTTIAPKEGNA